MNESDCSIGMKERNLSHQYLRAWEVKDCINDEWKRQMQYGAVIGTI